jgi:hypothetical protein
MARDVRPDVDRDARGHTICWHHYFLWTLPAAVFLAHRSRLLATAAVASLLCSAAPSARGLGCHMLLALGLFALVVHDVNVRSKRGT